MEGAKILQTISFPMWEFMFFLSEKNIILEHQGPTNPKIKATQSGQKSSKAKILFSFLVLISLSTEMRNTKLKQKT